MKKYAVMMGMSFLFLLGQSLHATTVTRQATMIGFGGANGKCTVEVNVDGVAELEISGDTGSLKTLAGQTAVWRRFQCNQPLPHNLAISALSGSMAGVTFASSGIRDTTWAPR
jgi:hypothetical protein